MAEKRNLAQRLCAIRAEITTVPKDGYNDFQKFHYVTDEAITDLVRRLTAKHGVDFAENVLKKTKTGKITEMTLEITLINSDDPTDMRVYEWETEAMDNNDKGVYKAYTTGLKYFWIKQLAIPTGDNSDDADHGTKQPQQKSTGRQQACATPAQQKLIRGLLVRLGYDTPEKQVEALKARDYPGDLAELPKGKTQGLIDKLNDGLAKKGE